MKPFSLTITALFLFLAAAPVPAADPKEVTVVPHVDLKRYAGEWFELARLPMFFQEGCTESSTTYVLRGDGGLDVLNRCRNEKDGTPREAKGKAWVADPKAPAKLKVSFFWPFRSDYWIVDLGSGYEYAVVATPDRAHLWLLSRTRRLDPQLLDKIVGRLKEQGFAVEKLIWRREPGG